MNHSQIVSFLWGIGDIIRDTSKRGKYQDVILPFTVLRCLDCVLASLSDRDDSAAICLDKKGDVEADTTLWDTETCPWANRWKSSFSER